MNIVLVIDQYDNSNNGTTVTARRYSEQLRRHGHHVTILACGEPAEHKIATPVHKIPIFQKLIESQGFCFAMPDEEAYYQAFKDADIVHFFLPFRFCRRGEELCRQMHIPTIAAFHLQPENITYTLGLGKRKAVNRFLYWWSYHVFYNRFRHIHCPSQFIADQLKANGYDADLRVISNGVDPAFHPVQVMRPKKLDGKFNILMIGRLSGEKRQDLIIKAAQQSKYADQIQLIFAGKGPKEKKYRKLGKNLKNPPIFGFYTQEELVRLINCSDLYVHASDAEIEGISCMEAFSCGLVPVISDSILSATNQYALDEHCLFRAGDATSLAQQIDYWIEHPEERQKLGAAYIEKGKEISVDSCVIKAEQMYEDAIAAFRKQGYKKPCQTRLRRMLHPDPDKILKQFYDMTPARRWIFHRFTNFLRWILIVIDTAFFGFRIEGKEHLELVNNGAVTVINHIHPMDCTMVKCAVYPHSIFFLSLRRNLELPFTGWLVKWCGGLPLPETAGEMLSFQRKLEKNVRQGEWIHYYAEGMLVRYHEGLRPMHDGAFVTAVRTKSPVIPMAMSCHPPCGLHSLWRRKPDLHLHIGMPQFPDPTLPSKQAVQELKARVIREMEHMLDDRAPSPLPLPEYQPEFDSDNEPVLQER